MLKSWVVASAVLSAFVSAGVVTDARAEDARVLPAGRSRLTYDYAQTSTISQQYDGGGNPIPISAPYNSIELSSSRIASAQAGAQVLINELNTRWPELHYDSNQQNNGYGGIVKDPSSSLPRLGDALSRGFLGVGASATSTQQNVSVMHGFTDRFSGGIFVPVKHFSVTVDHSFFGNNSAAAMYKFLKSYDAADFAGIQKGLNDVQNIDDRTLQGLLSQSGYNSFSDYDGSGIGDVVLGGRYMYYSERTRPGEWINSVQAGFTAPTGKLHDPANITEQDFGNGCWSLGLAHISNFSPNSWLTFSNGTHFGYNLPATRQMRIRPAPDTIPDASDQQDVGFHLGNDYSTNFGADFKVTQAITLSSSYKFAWHSVDYYQGDRPVDYTYESDNTFTYLETLNLGAGISGLPAFLKGDLPAPIDASLNFYLPTRGKNTIIAPYAVAEVAVYF